MFNSLLTIPKTSLSLFQKNIQRQLQANNLIIKRIHFLSFTRVKSHSKNSNFHFGCSVGCTCYFKNTLKIRLFLPNVQQTGNHYFIFMMFFLPKLYLQNFKMKNITVIFNIFRITINVTNKNTKSISVAIKAFNRNRYRIRAINSNIYTYT